MACSAFDAIAEKTEFLPNELYQRAKQLSLLRGVMPTVAYPQNQGKVLTSIQIAHTEPASAVPAWQAISGITQGHPAGACDLSRETAEVGYNETTYTPEAYGIYGPIFCKDQFTFEHNPTAFMARYVTQLNQMSERIAENRKLEHYISLSTKHIANNTWNSTAGSSLAATSGEATLPAVLATAELCDDLLEYIANDLITIGAQQTDEVDQGFIQLGEMGPVWPLLIGTQASMKLKRSDTERRNDTRYGEPNQLMLRVGATYVRYNFRHVPCVIPPRYSWDGAAYHRVEPYLQAAASGKGFASIPNPAYTSAEYEAAIVLNPMVYNYRPIVAQTAGLDFEPSNYVGDWSWVVGAYKWDATCADPTDKFGRHAAEYRHAFEPVFPEFGRTIIFKRCLDDIACSTCS